MATPTRLEIHSHSTVSDGRYSPRRLAQLMAHHDVELWALTDHDNVAGCRPAREHARQLGVEFIPGIEISADMHGESVHVLGYGFDPDQPALREYSREMIEARNQRMRAMIEKLEQLGYPVEFNEVKQIAGDGNVGRPHLARALVQRGYIDELQEAFDRWLADDGPGYVALTRPTVTEAAEMIVDAGGLAVLAHPARYGEIADRLDAWKRAGLWGLEVRHPSHSQEDEQRLIALADQFELGMTASNDFHGNEPGDTDKLGTVEFPPTWRDRFVAAVDDTAVGRLD